MWRIRTMSGESALSAYRAGNRAEIVGYGLYLRDLGILAIADLHIGYEEALGESGIHVPVSQYPKMKRAIERMIDAAEPEKVVIVGDVKHEFGAALRQEWVEVVDLLDYLRERVGEVVVVRGNHDNFLVPMLKKRGVPLADPGYLDGGVLFVHGHKPLPLEAYGEGVEIVVMGHEHPAVALRDELGVKVKFKCFLRGRLEGRDIYVLPALSPLMPGTELNVVRKWEVLSPVLREADLDAFEVYVSDLEAGVYYFGELSHLRAFGTP